MEHAKEREKKKRLAGGPQGEKQGLLHGAPNHVNRYSELPKPIPSLNKPGVVVLHFAGRSCLIGDTSSNGCFSTVMLVFSGIASSY